MWLGWKAGSSFNFCDALIFLPFGPRNPEFSVVDFRNLFFRGFIQLRDPLVRHAIGPINMIGLAIRTIVGADVFPDQFVIRGDFQKDTVRTIRDQGNAIEKG